MEHEDQQPDLTKDISPDLYKLLDEAGLKTGDLFNTRRSMPSIVNGIRTQLVMKLRSYVTQYGHMMYNAGYQKAKEKYERQQ